MALFPLLISAAMTVRFSPVILGVSFALTALITLFHPIYKHMRGLWMFLFTFIFSIPLNIRVITKVEEWVPDDSELLRWLLIFTLFCILVCIEEIAAGVIFKAVSYMFIRKPAKDRKVQRMSEIKNG